MDLYRLPLPVSVTWGNARRLRGVWPHAADETHARFPLAMGSKHVIALVAACVVAICASPSQAQRANEFLPLDAVSVPLEPRLSIPSPFGTEYQAQGVRLGSF